MLLLPPLGTCRKSQHRQDQENRQDRSMHAEDCNVSPVSSCLRGELASKNTPPFRMGHLNLRKAQQPPQPFPLPPNCFSCASNGTENCFSIFSRYVGPELYVQNGYSFPSGAA